MKLKIKDAAIKLGVNPSKIRYWDDNGFLSSPLERDYDSNYRFLTSKNIEDISTIIELQEVGFTLKEIKIFRKALKDNDTETVSKMVDQKVHEIDDTISRLKKTKEIIVGQAKKCEIHTSQSKSNNKSS